MLIVYNYSLSFSHQSLVTMRKDGPSVDRCNRDMVNKYGIKYFYDITDRSDFRANPDYKGVCHIALAQEGHCKPGTCIDGSHGL